MLPIPYALDAVNFLAADVRNLFGPFVNVFLVTSRRWSQTDVGLVTTATGLLGIAFQTPIGAAIDIVRAKRGVIVLTMAAMALSGVLIFAAPTFWPIAIALGILAVAGDAFAPAVRPSPLAWWRRTCWRGGSAATRPSITAATSRLRFWPPRSATPCLSARSFSWFPCSPP
jgi:MFS family permease